MCDSVPIKLAGGMRVVASTIIRLQGSLLSPVLAHPIG